MPKKRIFVIKAKEISGREFSYREYEYRLVRGLDRLQKRKDVDLNTVQVYEVIPDGEGGEIFILIHGVEDDKRRAVHSTSIG